MSNDINRVVLVGRLVREPELRSTTSGSYLCRFTLASNRTIFQKDAEKKEEVGYIDCISWAKLAEVISKYAKKGQRVGVDGSLRFSSWDNADGKKQSKVEIFVEHFEFLDNKQAGDNGANPIKDAFQGETQEAGFNEPFNDDSSIPF